MGRFAAPLAISAGALAAIYAAACVLPGEPSGPGRIQFTLDLPVPYRVPLGGVAEPSITISADGQTLKHPFYRLETLSPGIVRVDSTERRLLGVARGTASVRVVYPTATGAPDTVFAVRVVVAQVTVNSPTLNFTRLGDTTRLVATALDAQGAAIPDVAFTWSSSDSLLARVGATGLVTALDEGTVAIAAEADSVKGVASVAVTQVAAGVQLVPRLDTLHTVGRTVQFSAVAFDSTSRILPFAKPHWTSSDPVVVRVDTAGLATVTGGGTAKIIARVGVAADTATLVVQQVVRFLVVTPTLDTLTAIADTSRIVALARDSLHNPIPNPVVTWGTNDPTIATVDPTGQVTARANGVVLVTASSEGQSAFATVVVRQEAVAARLAQDSVALTGQGDTVRLSAVGLDRNGYPVAGTAFAWRTGSGCVATVDTTGLVTADGPGSAAIIATPANGGQSDTAVVSVAGTPRPCPAIAFVSARDGNPEEIYVMDGGGSNPLNLTNNPGRDLAPVWSPDGTRIAFTSDRGGSREIYAMNADGSGVTQLTNSPISDGPQWSPDGSKIAYRHRFDIDGPVSYILVMNADGSGARQITDWLKTRSPTPVWSPDGMRIAFYGTFFGGPSGAEIYVMNADGSGLQNLTNNPGSGGNPVWSPDGRKIAFSSSRDGNTEIYVMNADGSGQVNITNNPGSDGNPVWSPDGTRIAFTSDRDGNVEIYVMHADGSGPQNLTNNPGSDITPVWSPDGPWIAFTSDRDGNWEIYAIHADGSGLQNLTNNPGSDTAPAWRPR